MCGPGGNVTPTYEYRPIPQTPLIKGTDMRGEVGYGDTLVIEGSCGDAHMFPRAFARPLARWLMAQAGGKPEPDVSALQAELAEWREGRRQRAPRPVPLAYFWLGAEGDGGC